MSKYEKTKFMKYAERWLTEHEFEFELTRETYSKTWYKISKDGITFNADMPKLVDRPKKFMEEIDKMYNMNKEIQRLLNDRV